MCWCDPNKRTPWCGAFGCVPPTTSRTADSRIGKTAYYMGIVMAVAARSNCRKRSVGAILIHPGDGIIVATGYNGTPRGFTNCTEGGCPRCAESAGGEDYARCFCCHAEENTIIQAARTGARVDGSEMYTSLSPCLPCARMIVNAGIKTVHYGEKWDEGGNAFELLLTCGVRLHNISHDHGL